jgi:CRISPR-associated endoribonuclease Cas6
MAASNGEIETDASDYMNALSLSLYRVTLVARGRLDLPAYLGSTLRGAFGHVFRSLACPGRVNQPCPIPAHCPYHLIFETSPPPDSAALRTHDEIPRPFVIAPIANGSGGWLKRDRHIIEPGSELSFDLTLIGRAQEYFPYFVVAFREIDRLGRRPSAAGTGDGHLRFEPVGMRRTAGLKSRSPGPDNFGSPLAHQEEELSGCPQPDRGESEGVSPYVIPSETSASATTRDQRAAITHPARLVELRRIDLLDPLSDAAWPVYDAADNLVHPLRKPLTLSECAALPQPAANARALTLDFLTQTRLKHEGGWARVPEFQIVFRRLLGRLSSMARFHCGAPLDVDFRDLIARAGEVRLIDNQTRWVSWTRYSSRQRQRMDWEGLIGRATYEGDFVPFWPYLLFGQWTHVGKGATFGLGKTRLTVIECLC